MEVGIVEVLEEPQNPGSENLAEKEDEGSEVEHEHHAHQPVQEHGSARRSVEVVDALAQRTVAHGQRADVNPPSTQGGEDNNLPMYS